MIWFERCVRPNCCSILSADQASSSVMCSRWRVFAKRGSAWREMPDEAASEMIATRFVPPMKASFSAMLIWSCETPFCARGSQRVPPAPSLTKRILRPVISATCSTPTLASPRLASPRLASAASHVASRFAPRRRAHRARTWEMAISAISRLRLAKVADDEVKRVGGHVDRVEAPQQLRPNLDRLGHRRLLEQVEAVGEAAAVARRALRARRRQVLLNQRARNLLRRRDLTVQLTARAVLPLRRLVGLGLAGGQQANDDALSLR